MRVQICALAALLAACSPPAATEPETPATPVVDPAIVTVVTAAMPGVEIVSAAEDGEGEYEVTGTFGGQAYEFDLMGPTVAGASSKFSATSLGSMRRMLFALPPQRRRMRLSPCV